MELGSFPYFPNMQIIAQKIVKYKQMINRASAVSCFFKNAWKMMKLVFRYRLLTSYQIINMI